ncbi:sodium:calcium antiporter [bacterium]|nr:sodium:calcium antiporter [bacterium]
MNDILILVLGMACAGIGGELFVRGAVGIARWARISPGIIGATVGAFATSSPELSVSVNSALAGKPQIALGDALGSNVVNIALILGLALAISAIKSSRSSVRRDFPVALGVPALTFLFFLDGSLSRLDGILMLGLFAAWLTFTAIDAAGQRSAAPAVLAGKNGWVSILLSLVGLAFLITAGNLIVAGARGIAHTYGIDEFIIGATLVAIGTSAPELATAIIAKIKGHDEVGLGTLLGSNIFNGLFIIPVAASIHPIVVRWDEVAVALFFGLTALIIPFPDRKDRISRRRGVLLLVVYVMYVAAVLYKGAG